MNTSILTKTTKLFSYTRYSSDRQSDGSTLERQEKIAQEVAIKYGLELVALENKGAVSAFKGKNNQKGSTLADFISDVKSGVIEQGSWLVVENLDRISRETILKAQRLFMELLELGITIVTGMDNKVYSAETVTQNPMDLMYSIMLFGRAHEESKTKSKRTTASAAKAIDRHLKGERAENGYAYAIEAVGNNIWWSDCSDGTVKPHPCFYPIAKEIIELSLNGWGTYKIVGYLNEKHSAPRSKKDIEKGVERQWHISRVTTFLKNKTLIGEKTITLDNVKFSLKDYYPALLSESDYYKLQHIRKSRTSKSTSVKYSHMLTGLGILKCGCCGSNMYAFTHKKTVLRIICSNGSRNGGCRPWSFGARWLEDTILRLTANNVFRPQSMSEDLNVIVCGIKEQITDKESAIEHIFNKIKSGAKATIFSQEIDNLQADIKQAKKQLEQSKIHEQEQTQQTVEWGEVDERVLDINEVELRHKTRQKIAMTVKSVICHQIKEGHIMFKIQFVNDKTIIAHRTAQTLAFDGSAWAQFSDHYGQELNNDNTANLVAEPNNYQGIFNLPTKMRSDFRQGKIAEPLSADILRMKHIICWANGVKGAPKIIEDQYQVFKHLYKKYLVDKPTPAIHHIDNVYIGDWKQK